MLPLRKSLYKANKWQASKKIVFYGAISSQQHPNLIQTKSKFDLSS
jgi:hypothetical protein